MKKIVLFIFLFGNTVFGQEYYFTPLKGLETFGLIDSKGKVVTRFPENYLYNPNQFGMMPVVLTEVIMGKKKGSEALTLFNINGDIIKELPEISFCSNFNNGYLNCMSTHKRNYQFILDPNGEVVWQGYFFTGFLGNNGTLLYRKKYKDSWIKYDIKSGIESGYGNRNLWRNDRGDILRYSVKSDGKELFGYIDVTGRNITEAIYASATNFSEGYAAVINRDFTMLEVINEQGHTKFKKKLNGEYATARYKFDINSFFVSDGLIPFKSEWLLKDENNFKGYGYLDLNGNWAFKPQFSRAGSFFKGHAIVGHTDSLFRITESVINLDNKTILSKKDFLGGLETNGDVIFDFRTRKFYDKSGNEIFESEFPNLYVSSKKDFEAAEPLNIRVMDISSMFGYGTKLIDITSELAKCENLENLTLGSQYYELSTDFFSRLSNLKVLKINQKAKIIGLNENLKKLTSLEKIEIPISMLESIDLDFLEMEHLKRIAFIDHDKSTLRKSNDFFRKAKNKGIVVSGAGSKEYELSLVFMPVPVTSTKEEKKENNYLIHNGERVSSMPAKHPEFKDGGIKGMYSYLDEEVKKLDYKEYAGRRIFIKFIVTKTGECVRPKFLKPADEVLFKDLVEVITSFPKWKPGENKGIPVHSTYTIPVFIK